MPDILHRVGIKSPSPDATYAALATRDGLASWWTADTDGGGDVVGGEVGADVGGTIRFRFGANGGFDMAVLDLERARRVRWQVVDGPADWIGTTIAWELEQDGDYTMVRF